METALVGVYLFSAGEYFYTYFVFHFFIIGCREAPKVENTKKIWFFVETFYLPTNSPTKFFLFGDFGQI